MNAVLSPVDPATFRAIRDLRRATGVSLNTACKQLGVPSNHVYAAFSGERYKGIPPTLVRSVRYPRWWCPWTEEEDAALVAAAVDGASVRDLSALLERTERAIVRRLTAHRNAGRLPLEDEPYVGVHALVRALGFCGPRQRFANNRLRGRVKALLAAGAIEHRLDPRYTPPRPVVARAALYAFLHDERYWSIWRPDRLPDPVLRREFTELRREGDLLTVRQIAADYGISIPQIHHRASSKRPIARRLLPVRVRGIEHLYRRLDVERFDWSSAHVPPVKGLSYGRLLRPPRRRR